MLKAIFHHIKDFNDVISFSISCDYKSIIFSPNKQYLKQLLENIKEFLKDCSNNNTPIAMEYTTHQNSNILLDKTIIKHSEINELLGIISLFTILSDFDYTICIKSFIEELCSCLKDINLLRSLNFELYTLDFDINFNKLLIAEIIIKEILKIQTTKNNENRIKIFTYMENSTFTLELQTNKTKSHFSFKTS